MGDSETYTDGNERWIACVCGRTEIEHSHGNLWKCEACGRFHDAEELDRLAEDTRSLHTDT